MEQGKGITGYSNFLCLEYDDWEDQATNENDSWEWDIAVIPRMSLQMGNTWRQRALLILMGSKEDTLQSTLNKGDPKWECCQTVICGVVSRDTIMVRSHGFLVKLRK